MKHRTPTILSLLMLMGIMLVACATPPSQGNGGSSGFTTEGTYHPSYPFDPDTELSPRHFGSEEDFAAFVRSSQTSGSLGGVYLQRSGAMAMDSSAGAPTPAKEAMESSGDGDFSGTNNQVAGVDEGDILKTDGEYIYTVTGNTLFIIKAVPGESAEVTATIDLEYQPQGLFIRENNVVVFGSFWDQDYFKKHDLRPQSGMTYVRVYDVADRQSPEMIDEYIIEGSYAQSRMIDGTMYFVITSYIDSRNPTLPVILRDGVSTSVRAQDIAYYPMPYQNPQIATIHKIDLDNLDNMNSVAVMVESMQTMYMSEDALYIASAEYINEWQIRQKISMEMLKPRLGERDLAIISKIERTDDDVLSPQEKENKIYQVYSDFMTYSMTYDEQNDFNEEVEKKLKEQMEKYEAQEYTVLHKVNIQNGNLEVGETGKIPGRLNNQFALDESDGYLRAATTVSPRWWGRPMPMMEAAVASDDVLVDEKMMVAPQWNTESTNNVYVLDENMEIVGSIKGIAKGESIYSTRFIGERLYMVTFRQVDPFFVIDLSNPKSPRVLGELKVPGFSRYLHPYDDNIVIGLGRDATESGRQEGLKISLFDVSNVEKPKEIAQWVSKEDDAQSGAEWEHKAFLFDREKELLVIPASSYDWRSGSNKQQYNGAMVFRITENDISLRGIVDHSTGTQNYGTLVERSLYIGDLLYTKSPNLLRINEIDDLTSVQRVTLESKSSGPYPVY